MEKWLTTNEVAALLKTSKSTIYSWIREGFIPHNKVGRLVRFDLEEIHKWMRDMAVKGRTTRIPRINLN